MANKRILLVEGKDDEHVLRALLETHSLDDLDLIKEHAGYAGLLAAIPQRIRESEIGVLGIVIDANDNPLARWQAIRARLLAAGYPDIPEAAHPAGFVIDPPSDSLLPRVGAWLMPDNLRAGCLEDFLRSLVPQGDLLFTHAEQSVNAITTELRRFKPQYHSKALIHTWLAWQEEPGKPFGLAIRTKYLSASASEEIALVKWIRSLFF